MKIMVTGALGHIGSKLIRSLPFGIFEEVLLLDNLATNRYPSLFDLPTDIPFRFFPEDILEADLDKRLRGVDAVIHLAALTDAETSFDRAADVEAVNVKGTEKVAMACIRNGCRLFFPSTTSIYGTQAEVVDENCPAADLKPQSPYAESKWKAEVLLERLGATQQLDFVICRFGTIFGPSVGMRFHTAVNKFIWQACLGLPLTVWRTALHQRRPYLDLGDAVGVILFFLDRGLFDRKVYNVVTDNFTVAEIIAVIGEFIPRLEVRYVESAIMNQLSYHVRSVRLQEAGFTPRGNLRRGIGETVALFRGLRNVTRGEEHEGKYTDQG